MDSSQWTSIDLGLLVLRIGIGSSFVFAYGADKMFGGPSTWITIGENAALFGLAFWPTVWGFMAAVTEFVGGILLMIGLFFRPVLVFFLLTMTVAVASHIAAGEGPWHATEMATVFVTFLLLGPGAYSVDAWIETETPDGESSS